MVTLKEIILADAAYVKDSGFHVTTNRMIPAVSIHAKDQIGIYLQGHEADEYLDKVQDLWSEVGNVRYMDVLYHCAKQYVENLV